MSKLLPYLLSYVLLLSSGIIILRYLVPRDYKKYGKLSHLTAFLQTLLFFLYGGFPYLYLEKDWPAVSVPSLVYIVGGLLVFIGLAFLIYGMLRLGLDRSLGRGTPQLEQSGIYRVSRNPQAIACGFYVVGFIILWPSWYAVGWGFLFFALIKRMILTEEEHLRHLYGQSYQEYYKTYQDTSTEKYLEGFFYLTLHEFEAVR